MQWRDLSIGTKLFENVDEAVLTQASAAIENGFINEAKGISRFPGLIDFVTLDGTSPVYLSDWKGDLTCATGDGRVYRVDSSGTATNATGVPVSGGKRVIFDKTEDELLLAAGGPIIRLASDETEILSEDAPNSSHIGYIDGYVIAIETHSGRFMHSAAGGFRTWSPLDVFTADGKPDDLNAMMITQFRELLLTGQDSIEQFERLPSGDTPFFRRWSIGEGVLSPYTLLEADNGVWAINKRKEFVRISGQRSTPQSDDIGHTFETITDWNQAWTALIHIRGQKFILLQAPNALNTHGTKGVTALFDLRRKTWTSLYDWDSTQGQPTRWPGWSYHAMWGRHFVGGEGKVYEMVPEAYDNSGVLQRFLVRTAHFDGLGEAEVSNFRLRLKRGIVGSNEDRPQISVRARKDNRTWTRWKKKDLGRAGERDMYVEFGGFGCATTWQFEVMVTDCCDLELVKAQAYV